MAAVAGATGCAEPRPQAAVGTATPRPGPSRACDGRHRRHLPPFGRGSRTPCAGCGGRAGALPPTSCSLAIWARDGPMPLRNGVALDPWLLPLAPRGDDHSTTWPSLGNLCLNMRDLYEVRSNVERYCVGNVAQRTEIQGCFGGIQHPVVLVSHVHCEQVGAFWNDLLIAYCGADHWPLRLPMQRAGNLCSTPLRPPTHLT